MELLFKCMAAVHMELRVRECVSLVGITDQGAWIALQFNFFDRSSFASVSIQTKEGVTHQCEIMLAYWKQLFCVPSFSSLEEGKVGESLCVPSCAIEIANSIFSHTRTTVNPIGHIKGSL